MTARGSVLAVRATTIEVRLPGARAGAGVEIASASGRVGGEICAVERDRALVAMHGSTDGIEVGARVFAGPAMGSLVLGPCALGRAVDACGRPLDGGPPLDGCRVALGTGAPSPEQRAPIERPLWTGVRAIDGLLTLGRGARIGIFGAPGAGKSTLLETVVNGTRADAVVVGLIGERGREAREWIERCDARTAVVCATSDRSAAERARCARVAMAQACALRARGLHVLLVIDSLARFAAALRELAVAAGETAGRGGYPPSVFAQLAQLLEAAGPTRAGSVSLIATVLSDGDERDPVSDAARSLLDGHLQLSPRLAQAGRFPAIDVPASASRTMAQVAAVSHRRAAQAVRGALALLAETEDARQVGLPPESPAAVRAYGAEPLIERFLRQTGEPSDPALTLASLAEVADTLGEPYGHR